jgi:hypothetical protein
VANKTIQIEFPSEFPPIAHIYANVTLVNKNRTEIVIDFGYLGPFIASKTQKGERAKVAHLSRIIIAPSTVKRLVKQLTKALEP